MNIETLVEDSVRNEILFPFVDEASENSLYVELGVFVGGNLVRIADRIVQKNKNIRVVGVDNWQFSNISSESMDFAKINAGDDFKSICRNNLDKNNFNFVELLNSNSNDAVSHFDDASIDCLFIDALHSSKEYHLNELELWMPKIKNGGIIAGHDWPSPGIQDAVKEFFNDKDIFVCSSNGAYRIRIMK